MKQVLIDDDIVDREEEPKIEDEDPFVEDQKMKFQENDGKRKKD